jgi:4-carboxymuconolactone decarboxylase
MAETIDVSVLPRLSPVSLAEAGDLAREVFAELSHAAPDNPVLGTCMHNPQLMRMQSPLSQYLKLSDCLPARHREIAILRNAWNCGADYMWASHGQAGLACGLTQDEIDRISVGSDAPGWSAEERTVLRAADELHATCHVTDETWAELAAQYDARQLIELVVLVGHYRTIAGVMNAVGIRPPTGRSEDVPGNRFLFASPLQVAERE